MSDGNLTYRITVEGLDSELKQLGDLELKLAELTDQRKQQKQTLEMLNKLKGVDQKLLDEEKKKLGQVGEEIKKANEQKRQLSRTIQQAQKIQENDINTLSGMRARISQLRAEIEKKPIGSKEFKQMSKEISDLQGKVNGLDADMKNWRGNVGNYASALGGLTSQMGLFSREMQMARNAVAAVTTALGASQKAAGGVTTAMRVLKVALMSSGIGTIVVALGSLAAYFTRSEEGARKFKEIMTPVVVTLQNIADVAANAGELLVSLFTFDGEKIRGAWDQLRDSVTGFYQETKREIKEAQVINKEQWAQDARLRQSQIQIAKNELQIAKLKVDASEKVTRDAAERYAMMQKAMRLEEANLDLQLTIARVEFDLAKRRAELAKNDKETNDALAEAEANLYRVQTANFMRRKEMTAMSQEIMLKALNERLAASKVEEMAVRQNTTEQVRSIDTRLRGEVTMTYMAKSESEKRATIRRTEAMATMEAYAAIAGMGAQMFGENTLAYQVLASAEASINTYLAANKAFADPLLPFPSNIIMAGVITAMGLRNVAAINNIKFASGGVVPRGYEMPGFGANEDNTLAILKPGEVVLNEGQQQRIGGRRALAAAGVPGFASGGIVPRLTPPQQLDMGSMARQVARMIREVPVVVTEGAITGTQRRVHVRERMRSF